MSNRKRRRLPAVLKVALWIKWHGWIADWVPRLWHWADRRVERWHEAGR